MIDIADPQTDVEDLYKEFRRHMFKRFQNKINTFNIDDIFLWLIFEKKEYSNDDSRDYIEEGYKTVDNLITTWKAINFIMSHPDINSKRIFRFVKEVR